MIDIPDLPTDKSQRVKNQIYLNKKKKKVKWDGKQLRKVCKDKDCGTIAVKNSEGKTEFCLKHGGGKTCEHQDCEKKAQNGETKCWTHSEKNLCEHPDCETKAQMETQNVGYIQKKERKLCEHPGCETKAISGYTKNVLNMEGVKHVNIQVVKQ